jgi:hypothetical protein
VVGKNLVGVSRVGRFGRGYQGHSPHILKVKSLKRRSHERAELISQEEIDKFTCDILFVLISDWFIAFFVRFCGYCV